MDSDARRSYAKSFPEEFYCDSPIFVTHHILSPRTPYLSPLRSPSCSDDSMVDYDRPFRFSGVPFSWEHSPGISKEQQTPDQGDHSLVNHLPLPPSIASLSPRKLKPGEKKRDGSGDEKLGEDPFFAALIECSKEDDGLHSSAIWSNQKIVSRSLSDRFGLISLYCSCKRAVRVSDSLAYLPKSAGNSFRIAANHRLFNYK